ncbi:unnamed protein product [Rotaria magnacalcarata]|uniref:Uncharacterized protein n=1 Tax=Rotaria magnacalcarata TaxID=392030 RepID=A0A816LYG6_9BILA|nr:unnamed protein product [Rotaria magnacalcarata]CAF1955991.1 unnamed protein product [Rotaria magnacalcarata]
MVRSSTVYPNAGDVWGWNTGLFDCLDDKEICLMGLFCPCVLFHSNVRRTPSVITYRCPGLQYALSHILCSCASNEHFQRSNLTFAYSIPTTCNSWPVSIFCTPCALCQEARELNIREAGKAAKTPTQKQPR